MNESQRARWNEAINQAFSPHLMQHFATEWERTQGYKPAPFQKAIAMQRLERGQTVQQIIEALVAQRVFLATITTWLILAAFAAI